MAAPALEHNHSFKFQQSSPLDTLVRRTSSRRARGPNSLAQQSGTSSSNHSPQGPYACSLSYTSNAPPHASPPRKQLQQLSQLSPQSPLLHTQFRGSTISTTTYQDNSFLDHSTSFAGDQSHEAEYGIYKDDASSVYSTPAMLSPPRNVSNIDPEPRDIWEDVYTGIIPHAPPVATNDVLAFQVDSANSSLPVVVISPAADQATAPTRGGKAPVTVPPTFNFSRPGRPPILPPEDQKRRVIERNAGRHPPIIHAGAVLGPSSSMPNLPIEPQQITQSPILSNSSSQIFGRTEPRPQASSKPLTSPSDANIHGAEFYMYARVDPPARVSGKPAHSLKPVTPITLDDMRGSGYPKALDVYGPPSAARSSSSRPPTPSSVQHPDSVGKLSIRSISVYSNQSSAEPSPAAGQQLFFNEAGPIPLGQPCSGSQSGTRSPMAQDPKGSTAPLHGTTSTTGNTIYAQAQLPQGSAASQDRRPSGPTSLDDTPKLPNPHTSPSTTTFSNNKNTPGAKSPIPDYSDHPPASLPEAPSRFSTSTVPRDRIQLSKAPPSRAVSPAGSVYSQYSFYQLDGSNKGGSPTGSTSHVSTESNGFRSPLSDEPRPPLLSPNYTPPTRSPGAARSPTTPSTPPTDSPLIAQKFLQLGIQHHEANRLKDAAWCFERSAKDSGGCGVGMVMWGLTLRHGWGCEKNEALGFKWLQKAAESAVSDLEGTRKGVDTNAVKVSSHFENQTVILINAYRMSS